MKRARVSASCVVNPERQRSRFHLRPSRRVERMPFDAHDLHATGMSRLIAKIFTVVYTCLSAESEPSVYLYSAMNFAK